MSENFTNLKVYFHSNINNKMEIRSQIICLLFPNFKIKSVFILYKHQIDKPNQEYSQKKKKKIIRRLFILSSSRNIGRYFSYIYERTPFPIAVCTSVGC